MNSLENWIEHGADPAERGFLASARVILGNNALTVSELCAYLRHCAAVHREQGTDPAVLAAKIVRLEREARRPMTANEWKEFQK